MKTRTLLLALLLIFSLSACAGTPTEQPDATPTVTTTTAPLIGENDGASYKNTRFGLAFAPADGWDMYDNEEIADRNLPILPMEEGEDYNTAILRAQEFYDMYAVNGDSKIAVRVENMTTLYESLPSAAECRDMQLSMLEGTDMLTATAINATIDGMEHPATQVLWGEGDDMQTDHFVYIRKDDYMLILEFSSLDGDHSAEWFGWFDLL